MFLKQIDILSPEITLCYKGNLSHSSSLSGLLTIIAFNSLGGIYQKKKAF